MLLLESFMCIYGAYLQEPLTKEKTDIHTLCEGEHERPHYVNIIYVGYCEGHQNMQKNSSCVVGLYIHSHISYFVLWIRDIT